MPHIITAAQITSARHTGAVAPGVEYVTLADYHDMSRAFHERTAQLTECADECVRLTNERDALRKQLARATATLDALANECTPNNPGFAEVFNRITDTDTADEPR